MKKVFLLVSALALLAACGNNDDLPVPSQEPEPIGIDLRSMNYEGVMTLLSEQTSLKDVTFTDGATTRHISELVASDNLDPDQAEALVFNSAKAEDSLDLTVTPEYVSVRMSVEGRQMAYMAFADANQQNEIIGLYEETVPATRSGEPVVTRSSDGGAFSLDLTEIAEQMQRKAEAEGTSVLPERELKYQASVVTRGWFSNLFKKVASVFKSAPAPVVRRAAIDVYMLRERGANPLTHEMHWQVNDAISSLKDVYDNVDFNVHILNCDYKGSDNASATLSGFFKWLKNGTYRNTHGVFMLCRWGGYEWEGLGQTIGMAYLSDYDVNNDLQGCGISSTSAWNKYCVAHEIGHIFGAEHTHANLSWYQRLAGYDLMAYGLVAPWMSSGKHKDSDNRARIKRNLTLN